MKPLIKRYGISRTPRAKGLVAFLGPAGAKGAAGRALQPARSRGLGDLFHEQEILRACEQVLSGSVPAGVDPFLDVRQELCRVLHLIEDDRRRIL